MKKYTISFLSVIIVAAAFMLFGTTSCKKSSSSKPATSDSAVFLFHLHTQIINTTIGGNPGVDSNTDGSNNVWYPDSLGRMIELFVPQFFVSNIMLVNSSGTMVPLTNVVLLKGLDSEDYYLCKVPAGTYVSAMFTVGLSNTNDVTPPSTLFITDSIPYPTQYTMWNGSNYYGMIVTGAYDTTSAHTGANPIPFSFSIPNSLTTQYQVTLPTRGTGANASFPVYNATAGSTNYVHILCDYGELLSHLNLKTSTNTNGTTTNPLIADTLAKNIPNMFRYEQ